MTWRVELQQAGDTVTVEPDYIIEPDFQLEPTAVSSWSVEVPYSPSLEDWAGAEGSVYYDDHLIIRGPLVAVESDDGDGVTVLRGRDVVEYLRRARGESSGLVFDVTAAAGHEAIREFYSRQRFDDWATDVVDPDAEMQVTNKVLQSDLDWDAAFDPASDSPVRVANNKLEVQQTAHFAELEDYWSGTLVSAGEYSGGDAALFDASGDWQEITFSTTYDIAATWVGVAARFDTSSTSITMDVSLDGQLIDTFSGTKGTLAWDDHAADPYDADGGYDQSAAAGDHTLRFEITDTGGTGAELHLDCVCLYDRRYTDYTEWDNTTDTGNALDDPPLYPPDGEGAMVTANEVGQEWNIIQAELEATVDGGDYPRLLGITFGDRWHGYGDTESIEVENADHPTTTVQARVRLGADRAAGAQSVTPKYNHTPSNLDSWELDISGNDLPVINDTTYTGTFLEVWQELHADANMVAAAEYDETGKILTSFQPGDVTREADWTVLNHSREMDLFDYANQIRAIGDYPFPAATDRREAVVTKQAEVERVGGVIEGDPVILEDTTDFDKLRTEARTELADAVMAREMTGTVNVEPKALAPGYSYPVPSLADEGKDPPVLTLWSVSFSESSGSLSFGKPEDLAQVLANIRSEVRTS